jgi:hypothetical protein
MTVSLSGSQPATKSRFKTSHPEAILHEPLHRVITAGKLLLDYQVLVDPLRRQARSTHLII